MPAASIDITLAIIDAGTGFPLKEKGDVAVAMRIGQLVDVPNVGVTAVLPLDIFVGSK